MKFYITDTHKLYRIIIVNKVTINVEIFKLSIYEFNKNDLNWACRFSLTTHPINDKLIKMSTSDVKGYYKTLRSIYRIRVVDPYTTLERFTDNILKLNEKLTDIYSWNTKLTLREVREEDLL